MVTLWAALLLGLGWAMQGVPLLAHLVSEDSQVVGSRVQHSSEAAANQFDHACSSDRGRANDAASDRSAQRTPDNHGHHDPLDCGTCKTLLFAGAWAVPHVPSLMFSGWTPSGSVRVGTTDRVISFEFRAFAAPRGPPTRGV